MYGYVDYGNQKNGNSANIENYSVSVESDPHDSQVVIRFTPVSPALGRGVGPGCGRVKGFMLSLPAPVVSRIFQAADLVGQPGAARASVTLKVNEAEDQQRDPSPELRQLNPWRAGGCSVV